MYIIGTSTLSYFKICIRRQILALNSVGAPTYIYVLSTVYSILPVFPNPTCWYGVKCSETLKTSCYSRDCVRLKLQKETCQQDSLSIRIDWYQFQPISVVIRQYIPLNKRFQFVFFGKHNFDAFSCFSSFVSWNLKFVEKEMKVVKAQLTTLSMVRTK